MATLSLKTARNKFNKVFSEIIIVLLVLLWTYTAASKALDFQDFIGQMHNQAIPNWLAAILVWLLIPGELGVALLLLFRQTRLIGLWISFLLMVVFTAYIGLVLLHVFPRVPCSCGGVLRALGWRLHFVFNLFFLLLSLIGIYQLNRERSVIGTV